MPKSLQVVASRRLAITTGAVTTVAAATATAGQLLSVRWTDPSKMLRLRSIEVEFLLTTAFGGAQEVGCDIVLARAFTINPSGGTAVSGIAAGISLDGAARSQGRTVGMAPTGMTSSFATSGHIMVATTDAFTSGTFKIDANPIARTSLYTAAIGTNIYQRYDFTDMADGGYLFSQDEGFLVRNSILMGVTGVGRWTFTPEFDEVVEVVEV